MSRILRVVASSVFLSGALAFAAHAAPAASLRAAANQLDAIDAALGPATISGPGICRVSRIRATQMIAQGEALLDQLWRDYKAAKARGDNAAANALIDAGEELDEALDDLDAACWPPMSAFMPGTGIWGPSSGVLITAALAFGFGGTDYNFNAVTTQPTAANGSADASPSSINADLRAAWLLTHWMALTVGFSGNFYRTEDAVRLFDLDPFSPGADTTTRAALTRAYVTYLGLMWYWPTFSSWMAGNAGQPGAGRFSTTLYAGPAFGRFEGSVTTDELGNIRTTRFDQSLTGLRVGFDVDYPLWLSGFDTLRDAPFRPVIRAGVSADFYPSYTVNHQAVFNTYSVNVNPDTVWRGYIGVGLQFNPNIATSDIRLKRDIVRVGTLDSGLALYRYKYVGGEREYVGVMAQEVAEVMPDAVLQGADGYLRVDYGKLGISLQTADEHARSQTAATTQTAWRRAAMIAAPLWPGSSERQCLAPQGDFAMIVAALPDVLPVVR